MFSAIKWGIVAAAFVCALPASAADRKATGRIVSYECGDNCYLTIKTSSGKEVTALCAAKGCAAWNEQTEMPKRYIGRRVQVSIGVGKQYDGSGNLMGDFPAFTKVAVGK